MKKLQMKRVILLILTFIHILLSIVIFFIGKQYEFIVSSTNSWLPSLLVGILLLIFFSVGKLETIKKIPKLLFVIYPASIILILVLVFYELPGLTYLEATEMIEKNTGELVINDNKNKIKGQIGIYYIYTNQNTYIVDANTREYAQKN